MSAKPLNALNSGTVGVVLGCIWGMGGSGGALEGGSGREKNPQKKKSPENTFIRSPLPGDFSAHFWPPGTWGGPASPLVVTNSLGCEFYNVIYLYILLGHLFFPSNLSFKTSIG